MSYFKKDEILILLGAGASVDAGIPHSKSMIDRVESLIRDEWSDREELYNFVKSSIHYGGGVRGEYGDDVNFNIERLVSTLEELNRKEEHPLYPFVGAWIPKLGEVSGENFDHIRDLRDRIVGRLRDRWLSVKYPEKANYFQALMRFQEMYEHPLRVFTLNYDLCVEDNCDPELLERGFEDREWDWQRFELEEKNIFLYKLHGSTDWVRNEGQLTWQNHDHIEDDEVEIIFGTTQKMQYVDPFLFLAYELRKWTLSRARLIITIGYGFGDDHVNDILGQALRIGDDKKLLSIAPVNDAVGAETQICSTLQVDEGRVVCWDMGAKVFMEDYMDVGRLGDELFPREQELFPEVGKETVESQDEVEAEPVSENTS